MSLYYRVPQMGTVARRDFDLSAYIYDKNMHNWRVDNSLREQMTSGYDERGLEEISEAEANTIIHHMES